MRKLAGLSVVGIGVYLALQTQWGAAMFIGIALLCFGLWTFLGSLASFGQGSSAINHGGAGRGDTDINLGD